MAGRNNIIINFPIYEINSKELSEKLNAKTRNSKIKKLEALGVPVRQAGPYTFVNVFDVIEAFENLEKKSTRKQYIPKSTSASKFK